MFKKNVKFVNCIDHKHAAFCSNKDFCSNKIKFESVKIIN